MIRIIGNWRNFLRFYSTQIICFSGVLDIAVYVWTYLDGMLPIGPLKYLAISILLKALSLGARLVSQSGSGDANHQAN